jgi:hypothetical protein
LYEYGGRWSKNITRIKDAGTASFMADDEPENQFIK